MEPPLPEQPNWKLASGNQGTQLYVQTARSHRAALDRRITLAITWPQKAGEEVSMGGVLICRGVSNE